MIPEILRTMEVELNDGKIIEINMPDQQLLSALSQFRRKQTDSFEAFELALEAQRLSLDPGLDRLLTLEVMGEHWKRIGLTPYPHQMETVKRVLREMRGRAILADEVGLGKTIEAGIIIKEYLLRGLARRILVLCPASLCRQWQDELAYKFGIHAGIVKRKWHWETYRYAIASIDAAKRPGNLEEITKFDYDILVIDEAHKLKNVKSMNWKAVNQIRKKFCLMLTATPVQNDMKELFNLITLLRPGQLGTFTAFKKQFVKGRRAAKNHDELKGLISEVMIRNQRASTSVEFTARRVHTIPLILSEREQILYDEVVKFLKHEYRRSVEHRVSILPLMTLQREVCSSSFAVALTLDHMLKQKEITEETQQALDRLLAMAMSIESSSKADLLIELIKQINDKVIVFTEYRTTQNYLRYRLKKEGFLTLGFDGGLSKCKREIAKHLFRERAQILVSTESGGEGINLQFCNNIVNFDLPWNPMRVEQRIGRVHRLGQTRDVNIYNLSTKGTIEEYILYLLHQKINMFESVIGNLDTIVNGSGSEHSFERSLMDIIMSSNGDAELYSRLDSFGENLNSRLSGRDMA